MLVPMFQTGGTYTDENIKHTRLNDQTQYPDCLCVGVRISFPLIIRVLRYCL